jgi:hypothetical protein
MSDVHRYQTRLPEFWMSMWRQQPMIFYCTTNTSQASKTYNNGAEFPYFGVAKSMYNFF